MKKKSVKKVKRLPFDPNDYRLMGYMRRQPKQPNDEIFKSVPEEGVTETDITNANIYIDLEHEDPNGMNGELDFAVRNYKVGDKPKGRKRVGTFFTPGSNSKSRTKLNALLNFKKSW